MSTAVVTEVGSLRATPLPAVVMKKIAGFLVSGSTGKLILNIKCGEVRTLEIVEVVDAQAPEIDSVNGSRQD